MNQPRSLTFISRSAIALAALAALTGAGCKRESSASAAAASATTTTTRITRSTPRLTAPFPLSPPTRPRRSPLVGPRGS